MPKRIRRSYPIFIAPDISGFYLNDLPEAFDNRKERRLNLSNTDDKIYIYERQVKNWFLNKATRLIRGEENGFIVLMICLSYFEGVEQYRQGVDSKRKSKDFFINSIHRLYPNMYINNDLNSLYEEARCGLFHNGMVSGKIIINKEFISAIEFYDFETIKINPKKMLADIKIDFNKYIRELKDERNTLTRDLFNRMFSNL